MSDVAEMSLEPAERLRRLAAVANDLRVNRNTPIVRYFRSGNEMLKMGNVYYAEGDYEKAYILYHKYLTLFVEKLREHPEYKTCSATEKARVRNHSRTVLDKSEKLKLTLRSRYAEEHDDWRRQEESRLARLEEEERKRKEEEGRKLREEVAKYQEAKERTLAMQRDYETALFHQMQMDKEYEREQMEEAMRRSKIEHTDEGPIQVPQVDRASKPPPSSNSSGPIVPDRSTKPETYGLYSADKGGLRQVLVPSATMSKFLAVAKPNTDRAVETCGILCGRLSNNRFSITHVLVPKQKGTPDSCEVLEDDFAPFEYMDTHELITLGWIHTHPTQTAFLSSVDLHCHLPYQLMLPEAVAIVCAPKHQQTGFFVLTPSHGLGFISKCLEKGFHPHPAEPPLFEEGKHVQLDPSGDVALVDFR